MRIGIPVENGFLCSHFGRCDEFALVDVDETRLTIRSLQYSRAPEHEPGVRPRWLIQNGVKVAIVGGIGLRAQNTLEAAGIRVISGIPSRTPEELAKAYLEGSLVSSPQLCSGPPANLLNRVRRRGNRYQHGQCHQR